MSTAAELQASDLSCTLAESKLMADAALFARFGLMVIREFVDAETCADLISQARASKAEPSLVTNTAGTYVNRDHRRSLQAQLSSQSRDLVQARFESLLPRLEEHFKLRLGACEYFQFLWYQRGDFFIAHSDQGDDDPRHDARGRRISVVLFLNGQSPEPEPGAFCGGGLVFYGLMGADERTEGIGFPLSPEPGLLVAFPARMTHEVEPITAGERFTLVTWFGDQE